jgi:hypothetical protein
VYPDAAAGFPDATPDLQEFEPQGVDLSRSQLRAPEVVTQQPKQTVSRGVEQQPKLVGLEFQFQFFDAVFHVAPEHVDVVLDKLGVAAEIGDHKALIGAQVGVFHFGDDPAGFGTGFRLVAERSEKPLLLSSLLELSLRL